MSTIHMKKTEMHTYGDLPAIGDAAPDVALTRTDLSTLSLQDFAGKAVLLNVYPSIDTQVCFESVKTFHQAANEHGDVHIACVSMDLPFALSRVQAGEDFKNIELLSDFRNREFGEQYGLTIADGPLAGLLARAVIVLDANHKVVYRQLVEDISNPPDYAAALASLTKA